MLNWLRIKNLALVEEADMEFEDGFTVISGETGAGKSVVMGGVSLLLGERADKSAIRMGAERCEISGEFTLDKRVSPGVREILEGAGMDSEDASGCLQIRRVITAASSRNFINGSPVPLQVLKEIGDLLVDMHGANEHQSLARPAAQLDLLDRFGKLEGSVMDSRSAWDALRQLRLEKEEFLKTMPSAQEIERLRHEASEIERAAPEPGEDSGLAAKHSLASHSRMIVEVSAKVSSILTEAEGSVSDRLAEIRRLLQDLERVDPEGGASFAAKCGQISEMARELSSEVSAHSSNIELDERDFASIEERMRVLQTLKRRYGPSIEDVLKSLEDFKARISVFDNSERMRADFAAKEGELLQRHGRICAALSKARRKAAAELSKSVEGEIRKLGFAKAAFSVDFAEAEAGAKGADRIEFLFTGNPGVPPKPLRDVASSGETSRLMLAIKTVLAEADAVPVLIFDEIDVNIGGETASKVGLALAKLSKSHQILCISHLPQVASKAGAHFAVEKTSAANSTSTTVSELKGEARVREVARMLGGGKAATSHAKSMLKEASGK